MKPVTKAVSKVALFAQYEKDVAAFNNLPALHSYDPVFKRHAAAFHRAENRFIRAPVLTKEDALIALKYLKDEWDDVAGSYMQPLFRTLRSYIEGRQS